MITIQEVNAKRLLYEPAKLFKASHALRLGNDTFATLREEKLFNSFDKVTVESADGAWMFEQKGTFNRLVMVNEIGSNARSALFVYNRGMLELRNGRKYHWKGKRRFPIQWDSGLKFDKGPDLVNYEGSWANERGAELLRLTKLSVQTKELLSLWKIKVMDSKEQMQIEIMPVVADVGKELSLLALLGWYMIVDAQNSSS